LIEVAVIDTSSLGDRSYLLTGGTAALVVDPQRDVGTASPGRKCWGSPGRVPA